MERRIFASALLALLLVAPATTGRGQPPAGEGAGKSSAVLPLVLVDAPPGTRGPMVLLLSGDGNWAPFPRAFAVDAAKDGSPIVGLKARDYMSHPVTPERLASDLERAVSMQLEAWHRHELVVVGYSRGADWTAFVLNRWPAELRARVRAAAFVGLSERASFEFHFVDLFRDIERPTDLPVRPEVRKLVGIPMICVYGDDERNSFCERPVPGMQVLEHEGAHRIKDDEKLISYLLGWLGIGPETAPP
jgi:type IV secretory pathway VirJ component